MSTDEPKVLHGQELIALFHQGEEIWNEWVDSNPDAQVQFEYRHFRMGLEFNLFKPSKSTCSFEGFTFPSGGVYLDDIIIEGNVSFSGAQLNGPLVVSQIHAGNRPGGLNLSDTVFVHGVHLSGFLDVEIDACGSTFRGGFTIASAEMKHRLKAFNSIFEHGSLQLQESIFREFVTFNGSNNGSKFTERNKKPFGSIILPCNRCVFDDFVTFSGSEFGPNHVAFEQSTFKSHADFTSLKNVGDIKSMSFRNSTFNGSLDFACEEAKDRFNCVPDFRGVQFSSHFGLSGFDCRPETAGVGFFRKIRDHVDIERVMRLKQLAEEARDQTSELRYKIMEMEARRYHTTGTTNLPLEFFYWIFANYGRSAARPFAWLAALILLAPFAYGCMAQTTETPPYQALLVLSGYHSFPLMPAFRGGITETLGCLFPTGPTIPYYVFATLQTVAGIVLIYLIGLALRNKFRL